MSLLAYYACLAAVQSRPSLQGTIARWSVADTLPNAQGEWSASEGSRVLEPSGASFSFRPATLSSGAPALEFTSADRLRLRGGLDLSAATSMAYILVFESSTGATQVLLEHSANYDQTPARFICFVQGAICPFFHLANGQYHQNGLPFTPNSATVLGYRLMPAQPTLQARAQTLTDGADSTLDAASGPQFGNDALYVGGRGGRALPFVGKLAVVHLFRQEPDAYLFQQWLNYYAQIYS